MNTNDVYEVKKKITSMNNVSGKPMQPRPYVQPVKRPRFEERYKRLTTYLEESVYRQVELLYSEGKIQKKTDFFNVALKEYLVKFKTK